MARTLDPLRDTQIAMPSDPIRNGLTVTAEPRARVPACALFIPKRLYISPKDFRPTPIAPARDYANGVAHGSSVAHSTGISDT
jgi:hypothetical protein